MGDIENARRKSRERFSTSSRIPDPLEGIVPGDNRFERYRFFAHDIIGQIWPFLSDSLSRESPPPYCRYIWSAREPNNQYSSHNMVPDAVDISQIAPEDFELLVNYAGQDYVRTRFVSGSLLEHLKNGQTVISGGGSCIAETGDMTVINLLRDSLTKRYGHISEKHDQLLSWFGREIIRRNPTMTQISGASLGGQDGVVLLVESDMWSETFASLGIPKEEALPMVLGAYEKVYDSFRKRSQLINPGSTVVPVNFDELDLPNRVRQWLRSFGCEWDERIRVFEVIYTYGADTMPDAVKQALYKRLQKNNTEEHSDTIDGWLSSRMWARAKQADHFIAEENSGVHVRDIQQSIDSAIPFPKRFDIPQQELARLSPQKREDYQVRINHYTALIKMLRWVWNQHQNNGSTPSIGALGFADLPGPHNYVAHQFPDWGGPIGALIQEIGWAYDIDAAKTILLRYLDSEQRLHRLNFSSHFAYLQRFFSAPPEEDVLEMNSIRENLGLISVRIKDGLIREEEKGRLAQEREQLKNRLDQLQGQELNPFPLRENPFIHHSMQFLWDQDFCLFLKRAVDIEKSVKEKRFTKDQGKGIMRNLMGTIFPKLQAYYGYFYGISEFEETALLLRNQKVIDIS